MDYGQEEPEDGSRPILSSHVENMDEYEIVFLVIQFNGMDERLRRIAQRVGQDSVGQFQERWISLGEQYFTAYQIKEHWDLCFQT